MTLMRFDPFRDLERLTEQAVAGDPRPAGDAHGGLSPR